VKNLYLLRHAKSSWKNVLLKDFDRPLNKRGLQDAPFMAEILQKAAIKPDLIISSTALRTVTTAEIFAQGLSYDLKNIVFDKRIYEASEKTLLKILKEIKPSIENVVLIGHNPNLTELANLLTDSYVYNIPTSGVYAIRFAFDSWEHIGEQKGDFVFFEYPKKHKKS
jgi:phosphohistidine phosphatase